MRALGHLALAVSVFLLTSTARAGDDADDVLDAIYDIVEKACPEDGDGLPYNLADIARAHFTADLGAMLENAYKRGALDFDVLIDAQDCAITDLDVDVDDDEGGRAIGRAEFRNFGKPRRIEFLLSKAGSAWKVDDISYRHRNWSLRRDVK